jgi:hypothetical protein
MSVDEQQGEKGEHGLTVTGHPACCHCVSNGAVDCSTCLRAELDEVLASLDESNRDLCRKIVGCLVDAGPNGFAKSELAVRHGLASYRAKGVGKSHIHVYSHDFQQAATFL